MDNRATDKRQMKNTKSARTTSVLKVPGEEMTPFSGLRQQLITLC